ncbi:hypothetical protein SAMN04489707_10551, partial [Paenacidovorax caeni]
RAFCTQGRARTPQRLPNCTGRSGYLYGSQTLPRRSGWKIQAAAPPLPSLEWLRHSGRGTHAQRGGAALARRRLAWAAPVSWGADWTRAAAAILARFVRRECPATPGERHRRRRRQPPNAQAKGLAKRPWRHGRSLAGERPPQRRGPPKEQAPLHCSGGVNLSGKEDSRANSMAPGHGPHLPWRHAPCPPLPPPC